MKAKINVGFAAKIQAVSFNPVESTNSIEIEVEYKDDKDLEKQITHYQNIIRKKTIKNAMTGVEDVVVARSKSLLEK